MSPASTRTGRAPDFLAVVDAADRPNHARTPMPNVGDELAHHWLDLQFPCTAADRQHLIVPGFRSSRIHILDVARPAQARRSRR